MTYLNEFLFLKKSNKVIIIFFFFTIIAYYLFYPDISSKAVLLAMGRDQELKIYYGLWGYLNDFFYKFFDFIFGEDLTRNLIFEIVLAIQISLVWSFAIFRILNKLNFLAVTVFFTPFVLNYFTVCLRDALALGLLLLIAFKTWNKIILITSFFISFSIHKVILPLIILTSLFYKYKNKSKKIFLFITLTSIFISIFLLIILKYTDVVYYLPESPYKAVLSYPRIGFTAESDISEMVNRAYNFYGNFNLKILSFGVIGQLLTIFFKNDFPNNSFSLSFSSFFICASLSSIPNADRFIYHALILSFPFLINYLIGYFMSYLKKLQS